MEPSDADRPSGQDETTRFQGRAAFQQAIRDVLAQAAHDGCRELVFCDVDYADWPLGEPAVVDSLQQWAMSHRQLTLLAVRFDEVTRQHPRWVAWRRTLAHIVDCREIQHLEVVNVPTLVFAPGLLVLRRIDPAWQRGAVHRATADLLQTADVVKELIDRSVPAFPATTLGL